ncbi:MAG: PAS domain-containing protein [Alphaproteobacteria bacterium]
MSRGSSKPETPKGGSDAAPPPQGDAIIDTSAILTEPGLMLLRAWDRWRSAALLPSRADMRLEHISALLANVSLLEVRGPDEAVVRLAGTRICEIFGQELKGTNYLDLVPPEVRLLRAQRLQYMIHQPCGAILHGTYSARSGMAFRVEQVALPIRPVASNAAPQLISVAALLPGQPRPTNVPESELGRLPETFRFLDVGAGLPNAD